MNEEALEQAWLKEDVATAQALLFDPAVGLAPARREELKERSGRSRALVRKLRALYADRCQICEWGGPAGLEVAVCEAHHLQWLSRGGPDRDENLALLCPNHHRIVHAADAPFDFEKRAFLLPTEPLPLRLNTHL